MAFALERRPDQTALDIGFQHRGPLSLGFLQRYEPIIQLAISACLQSLPATQIYCKLCRLNLRVDANSEAWMWACHEGPLNLTHRHSVYDYNVSCRPSHCNERWLIHATFWDVLLVFEVNVFLISWLRNTIRPSLWYIHRRDPRLARLDCVIRIYIEIVGVDLFDGRTRICNLKFRYPNLVEGGLIYYPIPWCLKYIFSNLSSLFRASRGILTKGEGEHIF